MDDVVKILGAGLSGFGFLLMYLAYGLLKTIINKPDDEQNNTLPLVLKSVNRYMLLCLIMTLVVGVFTVMNTVYKEAELTSKDHQITAFSYLRKNDSVASDVIVNKNNPQKLAAAQKTQTAVLDTIKNLVQKTGNTQTLQSFNKYRSFVSGFADSVKKAGDNHAKIDSLTVKYNQYNRSINKLAIQAVNKPATN